MTRSHVLVPSAGTIKLATNQYTDGANVKDDEVVTQGEPVMPTYTGISGYAIAMNVALAHPFQIMAGASLNVYLRRLLVTQAAMATAAGLFEIQIARLTSAGTGGTAVTFNPHDTTDAAAGATGMTLPTVLGTVGTGLWRRSLYFMQTMPASGDPDTGLLFDLDFDKLRIKPFRIAAGVTNGLAFRLVTAPAAATGTITAVISEAPY